MALNIQNPTVSLKVPKTFAEAIQIIEQNEHYHRDSNRAKGSNNSSSGAPSNPVVATVQTADNNNQKRGKGKGKEKGKGKGKPAEKSTEGNRDYCDIHKRHGHKTDDCYQLAKNAHKKPVKSNNNKAEVSNKMTALVAAICELCKEVEDSP